MSVALKDIALKLKVSPSTVSRALSGKNGVSEEVRNKIVSYADKHMFSVNSAAKALRTGKGSGIILIAPLNRPEVARWRDEMLLNKLRPLFGAALSLTFDSGDNLETYVKMALAEKPRALIISSVWNQNQDITGACRAQQVAVLSVDSRIAGHDNIVVDRASGTCQMTKMFILAGCTHPVYFAHPEELDEKGHGRLSGIRRAYRDLGKEFKDEFCVLFEPYRNDSALGFEMASKLLNSRYIDAFFTFNDLAALGVQRAISGCSTDSLHNIMMVGFDDLPFSAYLPTSLSTITQPLDQIAERAAELLQKRLENFDAPQETALIPTRLVIRESSKVHDHSLLKEIFDN